MQKFKLTFQAFLIIFLLLLLSNCSKDESIVGCRPPVGAYSYIGYDSISIKINEGWIQLDFVDSFLVKGAWYLESINNLGYIGNQIGNGELSGGIHSKTIVINLNPRYVDNNVILIGTLQNSSITGVWQWVTLKGLSNWGMFKAEK